MIRAILNRIRGLFARYEGGVRYTTRRGSIPNAEVQSPKWDAPEEVRTELVRKSRYFERNNAIVNRLVDLFEQYVVGPNGIAFTPASSDEKWNEAARAWWDEWQNFCDLSSRQHFSTIQSLAARSWFVDGEIFIILTRGEEKPARPRIQLVESHRIATPPQLGQQEGKTIHNGIEVDPRGRPIGYWVKSDDDGGIYGNRPSEWQRIPADFMVHLFEPARPGMLRGLPMLYPVMTDLQDLDELQILELSAAKDQAETSKAIISATGDLPTRGMVHRQMFTQTTALATDGTATTEDRAMLYRQVLGGRTVALRPGEDIKHIQPNRPGDATRNLWDILTSKICAGVGISKLLVYPWSIQGTVTRADLDVASTFFRSRSMVAIAAFRRIYDYVLGQAINLEPKLSDMPGDWRNVTARPPRAVNVDVGRNTAAELAELEAGATTLEDIWSSKGFDWRERRRQRAKELAFDQSLETEFGLYEGALSGREPMPEEPEDPEETDDEEEPNEAES